MTTVTARRQDSVDGGRPREVRVKLTEAEYAELLRRADAERITIARLLVQTALGTTSPSSRAMVFELMAFRLLLQSIADSLNRLAERGEVEGYDVEAHDDAVVEVSRTLIRLNEQIQNTP